MLVRQAVRDEDGPTAPSAFAPPSWENPVRPLAANADAAQSIKGSLTVAGVTAFAPAQRQEDHFARPHPVHGRLLRSGRSSR